MILLKYPEKTEQIETWINYMEEMTIAFELAEDPTLTEPVLLEGKETVSGVPQISDYLLQLQKELIGWYRFC